MGSSLRPRRSTLRGWLTRGRADADSPVGEFAAVADALRNPRSKQQVAPASAEPMTEREFLEHLERQVREGDTAAMRMWARIRKPQVKPAGAAAASEADPFEDLDSAAVDELAERRERRKDARP